MNSKSSGSANKNWNFLSFFGLFAVDFLQDHTVPVWQAVSYTSKSKQICDLQMSESGIEVLDMSSFILLSAHSFFRGTLLFSLECLNHSSDSGLLASDTFTTYPSSQELPSSDTLPIYPWLQEQSSSDTFTTYRTA